MAADGIPLGESFGATTMPLRGQFSLQSLFIFSLRISPLLILLVFLREGLSGRVSDDSLMFFNALACTAIYGGIFAAQAEVRRLPRAEKLSGRSVMPSIRKGGFHGALFLCLALLPGILASAAVVELPWLQKCRSLANVLSSLGGLVWGGAKTGGLLAFFGFFLGASGGAVVGFIIEFRKRPRTYRPPRLTPPHRYYPKTSIDA
jgi:hypothetical protein